ncbi:hypothetical protein Rpal_2317 [Rhodopseudomonas palustris TIE-1]|nr:MULTISPECIES: hypothetical protein [Rhodopseudomonas]ACF00835.1 hypothetical protein Rpal_2317 [Rhodopseudomonas palustris TIE-1]
MTSKDSETDVWLPVIGRSLARMALAQAASSDTAKFKDTLARVDFLEALGLPAKDAAEAAGSTAASVAELKRQRRNKATKGAGNGKKVSKKARPGARR